MKVPAGLEVHEGARVGARARTGSGSGNHDFAQGELGDVSSWSFRGGSEAHADEEFGTIDAVKTVSDLFAPVSGE